MRALLIVALLGALAGCGSASSSSPVNARQVTAEEVGAAWPFTVDSGLVSCVRASGAITFTAENHTYAVNTIAQVGRDKKGDPDIWKIQRERPGDPKTLMPLNPIEEIGKALCKG